jgi:hypothetical protein
MLRRACAACRETLRPALLIAALAGISLIIYSLVPRSEIREILTEREACANFVYQSTPLIPKGSKVVLAVPCGMPTYYLGDFEVSFGNIPYNEETKGRVLRHYHAAIDQARAVFVDPDNVLGQDLLSRWAPDSYVSHTSPRGRYKLFLRQDGPIPAAVTH